jgi:hypothetical protein
MIDNLALAISHGLMLLAAWLLLRRPDLDHEAEPGDTTEARKKDRQSAIGEKPGA